MGRVLAVVTVACIVVGIPFLVRAAVAGRWSLGLWLAAAFILSIQLVAWNWVLDVAFYDPNERSDNRTAASPRWRGTRLAWGLALLYLVAALRLAMDGGATSLIAACALVAVAVVVVALGVRSGARGRVAWMERHPDPARRRG